MTPAIAVVGAHHTPARRQVTDQSLEEMIFATSRGALADAGLTIADIDAIMLSTTDQVEGRVIESMVTNGAAGGVGRDVTTLASAGEHAFAYGCLRARAGLARRMLVVVWSKESEGLDPAHADRLTAEPFFLRRLGMSSNAAAGLQASSYVARHGLNESAVATLRATRWEAASRVHDAVAPDVLQEETEQMVAWPLTAADLPHGCDMACAMVLATDEAVSGKQRPAWITGVGWVTDRYDLGERDLSRFQSLQAASKMAFGEHGSPRDADVVELQEISAIGSFAACESLGLAAPGEGASAGAPGGPALNPSGGNLPVNPGNAAGFLRLLYAAEHIRRPPAQLDRPPQTTVAAALHGFAGQGATVVRFDAERNAGRGA